MRLSPFALGRCRRSAVRPKACARRAPCLLDASERVFLHSPLRREASLSARREREGGFLRLPWGSRFVLHNKVRRSTRLLFSWIIHRPIPFVLCCGTARHRPIPSDLGCFLFHPEHARRHTIITRRVIGKVLPANETQMCGACPSDAFVCWCFAAG